MVLGSAEFIRINDKGHGGNTFREMGLILLIFLSNRMTLSQTVGHRSRSIFIKKKGAPT